MKKTALLTFGLACALPLMAAHNKWHEEAARHWQTSKEFTLAVANLMPAESYDFKPNPEEMGFGELMVHIAQANANNFAIVAETKSPLTKPTTMDKESVMKYLTDSFDFCLKTLDGLTDQQLDKMTGKEGPGQLSGRERLWSYFTHTAHHRGQAEVYLRVKNIKPPAYRF